MQNDCWRHISTVYVNVASGLDAYSSSYIVGDIFPSLDMVEIEKCQLRDTRLNVHLLVRVFQHLPAGQLWYFDQIIFWILLPLFI